MRHDPALLDLLESRAPKPFSGETWRATWASRDPLIGGLGGGRWSPPGNLAALYTSLEADGALAEMYHHLSRGPVFSSSHLRLHRMAVRVARVLEFPDNNDLATLGISAEMFRKGDVARSREVGAAAGFLELEGIIVSNTRFACRNLVLFTESIEPGALHAVESREINWPAWREGRR